MRTLFNAKRARGKRPCPLWVDAFQRDTQHLQADEVGAYMLILMAMWTRETCDFPDNDSRLARVSRVSPRLWRARIGPVIRDFFSVDNSTLISKRLREEAAYVERAVTQQHFRKIGKKHGKPLEDNDTGKTADKPRTNPQTNPTQQPNNPTTQQKEKKNNSSFSETPSARARANGADPPAKGHRVSRRRAAEIMQELQVGLKRMPK